MEKNMKRIISWFEFERIICSKINKLLKQRPSSSPFLSGDTYRTLADVFFDNTYKCTAEEIYENCIIFINSEYLDEFVKNVLPNITCTFTIISHQSDKNITDEFVCIAENSFLKHWFAQNCLLNHPKVTPLPIGLEDQWRHNAGHVNDFSKLYGIKNYERKPEIVSAFSIKTNPKKRIKCHKAFKGKVVTASFPQRLDCRNYRKKICEYMFVASPEGNGLDCHRTWEAIYLGVIPLVENNYMNRYFVSLGLPIMPIDNWEIPANWSVKQARDLYNKTMKTSNSDAAFFTYWQKKIREIIEK